MPLGDTEDNELVGDQRMFARSQPPTAATPSHDIQQAGRTCPASIQVRFIAVPSSEIFNDKVEWRGGFE